VSNSPDQQIKLLRNIPLRAILIIPVLLQVILSIFLVGYFSHLYGQKTLEQRSSNLLTQAGNEVEEYLDFYLQTPLQVSKLNQKVIASQLFTNQRWEQLGQYFTQQQQTYNFLDISYLNQQQELIGVGYVNEQVLVRESQAPDFNLVYYQAEKPDIKINLPSSEPILLPDHPLENFEPQQDVPWQLLKISTGKSEELILSHSASIYDESQQFLGLLNIKIGTTPISNFLGKQSWAKLGHVLIVEKSGLLIANSDQQPVIDSQGKRRSMTDIDTRLVRSTLETINQTYGELGQIKQDVDVINQSQLMKIMPYQTDYGLDWFIIVSLPRSVLLSETDANQQRGKLTIINQSKP
jgi:hypothetical protein